MNKWKGITRKVMFVILALIVIVLIYDAYAISKGGTEASISSAVIVMTYNMPFATHSFVFCCGVLYGHLLWRMKPNKDTIAAGIDKIK